MGLCDAARGSRRLSPLASASDLLAQGESNRRAPAFAHRSSPHRDTTMRALVFDFDGLILDTETSGYEAWRLVYEEHDQVLPRDRWLTRIGTDGSGFDPMAELCARVGGTLDAEQIWHRRMRFHRAQIEQLDQMPGVRACLEHARAESIGTAIASSSPVQLGEWPYRTVGLEPLLRSGRHRRRRGRRKTGTGSLPPRHRIARREPRRCDRIGGFAQWRPVREGRRPLLRCGARANDAIAFIRSRGRRSAVVGCAPGGRVDRAGGGGARRA